MKFCITLLFLSLSLQTFSQSEPISPLYNTSKYANNSEDSENPFYLGLYYSNGLNTHRLFANKHETHTGYKGLILSPNLLNDSLEQHDFRIGLSLEKMISKGLKNRYPGQIPNFIYTDNESTAAALILRYTQASKALKPYIELSLGLRSNSSYISAYNEVIDSAFRAYCDKDYFSIGISGGSQINIIEHKLKLDIKLTYLGGLNVEHFTPSSPIVSNNIIKLQTFNKPLNFLQFDIGILVSVDSLRDISETLNFQNRGVWY